MFYQIANLVFTQLTRIYSTIMDLTFPIGTFSNFYNVKVWHIVLAVFIIKVTLWLISSNLSSSVNTKVMVRKSK